MCSRNLNKNAPKIVTLQDFLKLWHFDSFKRFSRLMKQHEASQRKLNPPCTDRPDFLLLPEKSLR
jgi:hypothetical protein